MAFLPQPSFAPGREAVPREKKINVLKYEAKFRNKNTVCKDM